MNPLSPLTYYRRHKRQALLLLVLIGSLTLGIHAMVGLTDVLFETMRHPIHYLTRMSRLLPGKGPGIGWVSEISTSGRRTRVSRRRSEPIRASPPCSPRMACMSASRWEWWFPSPCWA